MLVMRLSVIGDFDLGKKGYYLSKFNPEANNGRGYIETTRILEKAMRFNTLEEVMETWKTQSKTLPLRSDGKPNRPLTAFSMSPETVDA